MSQKNLIPTLIMLLAIITACSKQELTIAEFSEMENQVNFSMVSEKSFTIDKKTDWNLYLPQPFSEGGNDYLLSLDLLSNSINVFDYGSGRLQKKIAFPAEGENSIPVAITGFHALSTDSLLIIDKIGRLYFADFESQVSQVLDLDPDDIPGQPFVFPNSSPMLALDGKLIFDNYYLVNEDRLMKIVLDLSDMSLEYKLSIPSAHIEGYWGVGNFGRYNHAYNPKTGKLIYNFPNLESLYVWDTNLGSPELKPAQSRVIVPPHDHILVMGNMPSPELLEKGPLRSSIYARIIYDPWRDVYYRIVGMPIKEALLDARDPIKSKNREYSVMVLDADFNWLGEFKLPPYKYAINNEQIFVNEAGLHFQKESVNEDIANFDIWNLQ